jgi:hypothetical protein
MNKKKIILYFVLLLLGSLGWAIIIFYASINAGYVQIVKSFPNWLQDPFNFAYMHLKGALWLFALLLALFSALIARVKTLLNDPEATLGKLSYYDRLLNITISLFFGVGVIYTAIGMEQALMSALSGINGVAAGEAGNTVHQPLDAMGIMERLVNGGLLIALSTTIVGGTLGYVLKLVKTVFIGHKWDEVILSKSK